MMNVSHNYPFFTGSDWGCKTAKTSHFKADIFYSALSVLAVISVLSVLSELSILSALSVLSAL